MKLIRKRLDLTMNIIFWKRCLHYYTMLFVLFVSVVMGLLSYVINKPKKEVIFSWATFV